MATSPQFCESCGSQLPDGVKFCVQCGAPVPESRAEPEAFLPDDPAPIQDVEPTPTPPEPESTEPAEPQTPAYTPMPSPSPAYTPPPAPPAPGGKQKSRLPCFIIAGIVVLALICVGVLALGAYLYLYPIRSSSTTETNQVVVEADKAFATADTIFDPFDDNSLGWETEIASDLATRVENGAYTIHTNEPATYFWIYPPVDFNPTVIEFDAWVDSNTSTKDFGTYGVICNLQDSNNFTYVELDPSDGSVYFSKFIDDEEISLRDGDWTESANMQAGAGAVNHIRVECFTDSISLSINGSFEDQVKIEPPAGPGQSGLLIGTWDTIDPNGYKVFFDNFYGSVTQQQP